jgi:hypothetical protein
MMMRSGLAAVLVAATLLCPPIVQAEAQITSNVFRRVLMIRPAGGSTFGTGFTLELDGRQYLITAKHVVESLKVEDTIEIRNGDQWSPITVKIFRCADPIDIAVLVPPKQLTVTFPLEPTMAGIRYAQDMYFAGFPYGLFTSGKTINSGFPIPFVKKAIMSASTTENGVTTIYLDGHNNPGFSGGPMVYRDLDRSDLVYKLAGVVQGFPSETTPVFTLEKIRPDQVTPEDIQEARIVHRDNVVFRLQDTKEVVQANTGIVVGYSIGHALDLIKEHPLGPNTSEAFQQ